MAHYFITGASSGIGAALAVQLTAAGHQVSAVARRQQRLAALSKQLDAFHGYVADVGDAESLATAIHKAKAKSGPIDVAILNAGIYQPQDGIKIDPQIYANHMTINYLGVVNALAGLVPDMVRDGEGHIAIVSSVAGWRGLPKSAAYGPTKAALISLAESLYFDLVPHGLKIQVICPGFVDSEATAVNDFEMPDLISADSAASAIISGMQGHDFSINFPKSFTRKMGLLRLLPDRLFFRLVGKQTGAF
ncbi:SDR family NAD(P)-dependent oxidoreductase [Alphaproteobacteria bacterium]|nr:SDR family NAD(P)-dependent oxidoreductase [Alphaproteobacteria bacterium]MDA9641311.1 SDR family NAD(P)-dependent oxidoreductase [Alphaproteobacteria bacterium]|tara:strand:+ start:223 stop:966 length:744 start_codon:yes stop_codon:yes gene_type:complete